MAEITLQQFENDTLGVFIEEQQYDGVAGKSWDVGTITGARSGEPRFDLLTDELSSDELTAILDAFNEWRFDAGLSVVGQMSDADGEAIV